MIIEITLKQLSNFDPDSIPNKEFRFCLYSRYGISIQSRFQISNFDYVSISDNEFRFCLDSK